jgi:hypothetical protein
MNKHNMEVRPLTPFLPMELKNLLESGWQIREFHRDALGYGVHLVRGGAEKIWRFNALQDDSLSTPYLPQEQRVFS